EERERDREEHGEEHVDPLRLPPEAREEELLIRVPAAGVAPAALGTALCPRLRRNLRLRLDRRACHRRLKVALPWARASAAPEAPRARSTPRRGARGAPSPSSSSPGRRRGARRRSPP